MPALMQTIESLMSGKTELECLEIVLTLGKMTYVQKQLGADMPFLAGHAHSCRRPNIASLIVHIGSWQLSPVMLLSS